MELYLFDYPRFVRFPVSFRIPITDIAMYNEKSRGTTYFEIDAARIYYALGFMTNLMTPKDLIGAIQDINKKCKVKYVECLSFARGGSAYIICDALEEKTLFFTIMPPNAVILPIWEDE